MRIRRREFIKTAGGIALGTVVQSFPSWTRTDARPVPGNLDEPSPPDADARSIRVAVLFEPGFPAGGIPVDQPALRDALKGMEAEFIGAAALADRLARPAFDVFVNPYGSDFPKAAFHTIAKFLLDGGGWVNLGGTPFSVPVDKTANGWTEEISQTAYHKRLGITQTFPVGSSKVEPLGMEAPKIESFNSNPDIGWAKSLVGQFTADRIHELYVRFTSIKDFPNEDGSAGPRDAVLTPLVHGFDKDRQRLAAPIIEVERFQGDYAGGCWVLANFDGSITADAIRLLVQRASLGAAQLTVRTSFASYYPGELPSFSVEFRRPDGNAGRLLEGDCRLEVMDERGERLKQLDIPLRGTHTLATGSVHGVRIDGLKPGLYQALASVSLRSAPATTLRHRTGFWMFDESLLKGGKEISAGNRYLLRGGEPFPVTGTTYMSSDVHRKFLFEPNPYLWHKDFAEMKSAGINMVRTGIWTGWKEYMLDAGAPSEAPLRALDAFILTARRFDIPVIFTFFAFLPETWGGINPYLDPRSVNAQKEFVTAVVRRYRDAKEIIWDLINEPSFCNPQYLWQCRPNYDRFETEAWDQWLSKRYGVSQTDSAGSSVPDSTRTQAVEQTHSRILEAYRGTSDEGAALPTKDDFDDANIFVDRRPVKVIDYRLFAQEMFAGWVKEMTDAIRQAQVSADSKGSADMQSLPDGIAPRSRRSIRQLITVGQDEGGTYEAPGNQFFSKEVDFTCVHNWWLNDDLLWDQVVTTVPGKANLVEETGVMFYEKMDSTPWRSEEDARNLLERKMAMAIGAGSAGFVEWVWNTNPYMTLDNESGIGFHRVDGTVKPELLPLKRIARFVSDHRTLMTGRKDEDVVMVIPHSQMFSTRNFATDATRRCVRILSYELNTPVSAVSEYSVRVLQHSPKLLILPAPRTINQQCWDALLSLVEHGSTLLVTGVIDTDDHWLPLERSSAFGSPASIRAVAQEEFLTIGGTEYRLSFRGDKIQRIEKSVTGAGPRADVQSLAHGAGKIIWCPLPVELSETVDATIALYSQTLTQAQISPLFSAEPRRSGVLVLPSFFNKAILFTMVSESDRDTEVQLTVKEPGTTLKLEVPAQRTLLVFVDRATGKVIDQI